MEGRWLRNRQDTKKLKLSAQYRFQWEEAQNCYVLLYPEGLIKLGQSSAEILKQFLEPQSFKDALSNLQTKLLNSIFWSFSNYKSLLILDYKFSTYNLNYYSNLNFYI